MLLSGNGRLITRDAQNHFFENGCVAIDGQVVKQVAGVHTAAQIKQIVAELG